MCNVPDKKQIAKLFSVSEKKFHDHKQWLLTEFTVEIKKLGNNPDIGWCGDQNKKQICFKSRINAKSVCLGQLINDYFTNN